MVQIPYEGTVLHGYFYRAAGSDGDDAPRPAMVVHNGFDGPAEEMHYNGAAAGAERGYHVLSFDGPGHARRPPPATAWCFRPDWEHVVTPVLDWVLARPEVDSVPRRAARPEHGRPARPPRRRLRAPPGRLRRRRRRLRARHPPSCAHFPGSRADTEAALRADSAPHVDALMEKLMASDPTIRWAITHGMYVMGADTPRAFAASYLDYTLADGIAEQITCPTLVCDGENDMFWPGQPQVLFDHLTCPKTLLRFTSAEGAGAHSQFGAQRLAYARIYDWLDDTLANRR